MPEEVNKGKAMDKENREFDLQLEKIELVKLRIKNGYYNRDDVLVRVVSEIYENNLKKKNP